MGRVVEGPFWDSQVGEPRIPKPPEVTPRKAESFLEWILSLPKESDRLKFPLYREHLAANPPPAPEPTPAPVAVAAPSPAPVAPKPPPLDPEVWNVWEWPCHKCGAASKERHHPRCFSLEWRGQGRGARWVDPATGKPLNAPPRRSWPRLGERLPRCEKCGRAIQGSTHKCSPLKRPLRRTHRHPETDRVEPAPPVPARASLAFPPEGVEIDVEIRSELNVSGMNWQTRRSRSRAQRAAVERALAPYVPPAAPWRVELAWIHLRQADDDNVQTALKSLRDAVAEGFLRCDDGDRDLVTFGYSQEICTELEEVLVRGRRVRRGRCAVRVRIATDVASRRGDRPE